PVDGATQFTLNQRPDDLRAETGADLAFLQANTVVTDKDGQLVPRPVGDDLDLAVATGEPVLDRVGDELGEREGKWRGVGTREYAEFARLARVDRRVVRRCHLGDEHQNAFEYLVE